MPLTVETHARIAPVTDGARAFREWESRFDAPAGREAELAELAGAGICEAGFEAIRAHLAAQRGRGECR